MNKLLLDTLFLGSPLRQWLLAVVTVTISALLLRILRSYARRRVVLARQDTEMDFLDIFERTIGMTNVVVIVFVSLYLGSLFLKIPAEVATVLNRIFIVALIVQGGIWGTTLLRSLLEYYARHHGAESGIKTAMGVLTFLTSVVVWGLVVLLILSNSGVDITALVAGLGVGGIAVALAVQNILGDLLASLSIVLDRPFEVGDFINVNEQLGRVERIGIKTTRVRSLSGEEIVFPNADLLSKSIRNFRRMFERRVLFSLGVTYGTPAEKLAQIPGMVQAIIEDQSKVRFDRAHFQKYGDSALIFEVVYYVLDSDYQVYARIEQNINLAIYRAFEAEGIQFAFPTRTIILEGAAVERLAVGR